MERIFLRRNMQIKKEVLGLKRMDLKEVTLKETME